MRNLKIIIKDDSELYLIRKKDKIESYLKYRGKL